MARQSESKADARLLEATRDGDASAFELFYKRHVDVLLAYCARRVGGPEIAADLVAETFMAALIAVHDEARELPDYPVAWLFTIAHRKLINSYRSGDVESNARRRLQLEPLDLEDADLERINRLEENLDVLGQLSSHLPEEQMQALKERVLEERSYAEIAGELRCSEAVVRKRVSRALTTLRNAIGEAR